MSLRILIVEEALKNKNGHWYEYNKAIVEEARSRGVEVDLLAHMDIEQDVCDELKALPWFPVTSWDQVYYHPNALLRYWGILKHNLLVARLMKKYFKKAPAYDVVLVPTVVLYHWLAWRWFASRGCGRWFKRLVLTTRNNAGEYDAETKNYRFNSSAKVLSRVLKTFNPLVKNGAVELASDSSKLAEQYETLCGIAFETYPHPRILKDVSTNTQVREKADKIVIAALGPPRYEKGSDLVVEAIKSLLKTHPDLPVKYVVHWTESVYSPDGEKVDLPQELEDSDNVEVIRSNLSSEDYQGRLDEANLLLVPYRRQQYHARLSGIAIEAFQSSASCICVSDTWIEDCMHNIGSGISIDEENSAALKVAVLQFIDNYKKYQANAIACTAPARNHHSARAFVDRLLKKKLLAN